MNWTRLVLFPLVAVSFLPAIGRAAPDDTARVAVWFDAHKERTPVLRQFLQRMPKGADLHSHMTGAVYAESYLKWAADADYCVDTEKLTFIPPPCEPNDTQVRAGALPHGTYARMVDRMSTRDVAFVGRSGHDQFFDTFGVFGSVSGVPEVAPSLLAELTNRAAAEHILHLELMTTVQGSAVRALSNGLPWSAETDLGRRRQWLLDNGLARLVEAGRADLTKLDAEYRRLQHCDAPDARAGCRVTTRWLLQSVRTAAPDQVFAQLAYAFELARADKRVAGINLVAPEDDVVALRDYRLHMDMVHHLSLAVPQVNVALHAGELVLGLVPPEELRSHISDAVAVAGARRIGHGVDIGYEDGAHDLLKAMRTKQVAVEICLTSNDVILGVKGRDHPFPDYLAAGVPVVLASDDQGVSRVDLTNEYLRAAQTYGLGYRELKQLSRNSLEYSFLPGASLWQDVRRGVVVAACRRDKAGAATPTPSCEAFLGGSERAQRQWALEADLTAFERMPDLRPAGR